MAQIFAANMATQAKSMPVSILGSPSAGNERFAAILQNSVLPKPGGVRIWNDGDIVPWLGLKGYGRKSFAGLEVMLEGRWHIVKVHTQYTTTLGLRKCITYQFPEPFSYIPRGVFNEPDAPTNLRVGSYAEMPAQLPLHTSQALRAWQVQRHDSTCGHRLRRWQKNSGRHVG